LILFLQNKRKKEHSIHIYTSDIISELSKKTLTIQKTIRVIFKLTSTLK